LEEFLEKNLSSDFRLVIGCSSKGDRTDRESVACDARAKNRCKQRDLCLYEVARTDLDVCARPVSARKPAPSCEPTASAMRAEMLDLGKKSHLAGIW